METRISSMLIVHVLVFALAACQPPAATVPLASTLQVLTPTAIFPTVTPLPSVVKPSPTLEPSQTPVVSPSATPTTPPPTVTPSPTQPKPTATRRATPTATVPSAPPLPIEPRSIALIEPPNSSRLKFSMITFRWLGGALRPGETFLVKIVPDVVNNQGQCRSGGGKSGVQYSPPLISHEWTTDIFAPRPGQLQPCPGHFDWVVYVRDAGGNIMETSPTGFFWWYPL